MTFSTEESLININTADFETLCLLPGIGPTKAQAIIQYREENGLFLDITDIQKVKGIGPTLFNTIKDQITIGD
ncbi:MAG TPA: ComEA family DNA-binding protein [Anaerolineaceae bacterium]|nr:ComEA family DNA-binding protein [Anaerolineaceae bacterium]